MRFARGTSDGLQRETLVSCMTKQEIDLIRDFQQNAPSDKFFEKMVGDDRNHPGWLGFAAHYGIATRLLDATSDPLVALHFACKEPDDQPGRVWLYPEVKSGHGLHDPTNLFDAFEPAIYDRNAIAWYREGRPGEYQMHRGESRKLIDTQFLFDFEAPNRRVIAQRGKFIYSGSPLWPLTRNALGIEIPAKAKRHMRSRLSPFGITQEGLFPARS